MEEIIKILVVDDDEVDRIAVRRALKAARVPMEIEEAIDCASAIAILKYQTFDCIFLDYLLPDGDGLTLVQQVRAQGVRAPLVVLTGQGDEQIAVELMKAGASDYLSKAKLTPENLSQSLRNAIRLYKAEMQAAQATKQRIESEERFRLVLEGANDGIWDWDIAKNEIYWNDRFFEITGLSPGEFGATYEAFCDLVHPEDRPRVMNAVIAHLEQQLEFNVEMRLRHACGEYRYCVARAKAQRDALGTPFRMSGTVTDMTERKQAEEALRFLAEASSLLSASLDYQTTLNNLAHLIVPHLADWCAVDLVEGNKSWLRVAVAYTDFSEGGLQKAESGISPSSKILTPSSNPESMGTTEDPPSYPIDLNGNAGAPKVLQTGQSELFPEVPDSLLVALAHGEDHLQRLRELGQVSAMCLPIRGRSETLGTLTFVSRASERRYSLSSLALAEDLAQRAALAIDNARLYREAQEANRMKDEFLAIVSHELRTPLNAMLGWAQLLKTRKLDAEKTVRAIDTIERNARSQSQMIEDLLDVSRIIRGKLNLNMRPVELSTVIEGALDTVRPAAAAKGIEIDSCFDPKAGLVSGDADRLQQVVWNLVSNAVKFTPKGGRVRVTLGRDNSRVQIRVQDNGVGIEPEFLPFVFDRFRQADGTPTRSYGGLGLGLAIVRHLVELHGGSVHASSPGPNKGSTFTVHLPHQRREGEGEMGIGGNGGMGGRTDSLQGRRTVSLHQLTVRPPLHGLQVLIVDNEADARELLSAILKQHGADVREVASASEALEVIEASTPDVLVSDIGMPVEDGYSLIRKVRALEKARGGFLPAVALTAYARESDRACALSAGFQVHLPKPVDPAQLVSAIHRALNFPSGQ